MMMMIIIIIIMSLNCSHQRAWFSSPRWYVSIESWWNNTDRGNAKNLEKNLSHFCHQKVPHGLTQVQTQASMVRGP
jgi:hypothetical protein